MVVWDLMFVVFSNYLSPRPQLMQLFVQPAQIGQALSIMGAISIPLKLSMTVLLHPRWPNALTWLFNFSMGSWVVTFLGFPLLSWVVAIVEGGSTDELPALSITAAGGKLVWFVASFVLFLSRIGCMSFTYVHSTLLRRS